MAIIAHPTDENLRIHVERDPAPSRPYHDGGFPIWRVQDRAYYGGGVAQETDLTSYVSPADLDAGITELLTEHGPAGREMVERYLRIFWGATFAQWWHSGSYWYLTADPVHWREHVGITDEITKRDDYAAKPFDEFEAWVNGEVWVAVPQRRIFVRSHHQTWDLAAGEVVDESEPHEDTDEHEEWVESDEGAVGGFYGELDEGVRVAMLWNFSWPSHACKGCGEPIIDDVAHGWVIDGPPYEDRGRFTHCAKGVMMHVRGPRHEPKTPDPIEED